MARTTDPQGTVEASQTNSGNRRAGMLWAGALAGLTAALAMTAFMALTRLLLGVPSPAEMIGDVVIPGLSLKTFFDLIGRFNGGNGIKKVGISSVLIGQIVAGVIAGIAYGAIVATDPAVIARRPARFGLSRRGTVFVVVAGALAWLATIIPLRSVLYTSYRGLPAGQATGLTISSLFLTYALFGVVLVAAFRAMTVASETPAESMAPVGEPVGRRALLVGGVALVTGVVAGGLVRLLYGRSTLHYDGTRYRGPDIQPITPNDRFYSVTKNILDPDVAKGSWRLRVDGRVANARTYTFDELTALPAATTQEATVSCISNDVGDGLASNAVWRGVPLRALLDAAGLQQPTVKIVFYGADNYTDTILLDKALDPTTFVAWEMNGAALPPRHGYPVRVVVPGRFGEKSVKWVTRIEVVDHDVKGFYERQGWGPTFTTQTFSRFDEPIDGQTIKAGIVTRLHGIAFGGDRGIARVEVSSDDGKTWQEARLDYQTVKVAWTLWSLNWRPPAAGEYKLAVRATDGTGTVQTAERRSIDPDGATGYHRVAVRVEA